MRFFFRILSLAMSITGLVVVITQPAYPFQDVEIHPVFAKALLADTDFMSKQEAGIFSTPEGQRLLVGVGRAVVRERQVLSELQRIGQIRARIAILEKAHGVNVYRMRQDQERAGAHLHSGQSMSLSSFLQVTESRVQGTIQALPVIGTWRSNDGSVLFVAVGALEKNGDLSLDFEYSQDCEPDSMPDIQGDDLFVSLIRQDHSLYRFGGLRGFTCHDAKFLVAAGSSSLQGSQVKARRVAMLKAYRSLLGEQKGITVLAMERLSEQEVLQLSHSGSERVLISDFLSLEKEQVRGVVQAMPVVAEWFGPTGQKYFVAVGQRFEN